MTRRPASPPTVKSEVLTDAARVRVSGGAWEALMDEANVREVVTTLEAFGDTAFVVVARDSTGVLVGCLAVRRCPVRIVGTLPASELRPFGPGLRLARGREEEAAHALAQGLVSTAAPSWDALLLEGMGAAEGLAMLAAALEGEGRRAYVSDDSSATTPLLRAFNSTPAGLLGRAFASVRRRANVGARVAREVGRSDVVRRAASRVASYRSLHLYRGELFVRDATPPPGVTLRLLTLGQFEDWPERAELCARLGLDEAYAREKWRRGDTVVLAEADGRPAGILWCAHAPVAVPEIGRDVRPGPGECYIHDVFVAPEARGRAVAPAMLDFLARELRGKDVYRAWALIERSNTASTRAFAKSSYAPVADVMYARVGRATRIIVRPPDAAARQFLGLPSD